MLWVTPRQDREITDVEREDATSLSGNTQQLSLITGIEGHPLRGGPGYIVSTRYQRLVQGFDGRICIQV
ncbi:MAG: hypothetical protein Kow0063_08500 [Anaerolineae bacterium]